MVILSHQLLADLRGQLIVIINQPDELKGIFTLGEKDKETLDKIDAARAELDLIKDRIDYFGSTGINNMSFISGM